MGGLVRRVIDTLLLAAIGMGVACYSDSGPAGDGLPEDDVPAGADAGVPETSAEWGFEVVDLAADDGESVAITAGATGQPHILYMWSDNTGDELHHETRYATRDGGGWHIETVREAPGSHISSRILLRPDGLPEIAWTRHHYEFPGPFESFVARGVGGAAWEEETIAGPGEFPNLGMDLDVAGGMHLAIVAFEDCELARPCFRLRYATNAGGAWTVEDVEPGDEGNAPAIAIDPAGEPRIAYVVGPQQPEVRLARHDAAGWQIETIADAVRDELSLSNSVFAHNTTLALVIDETGTNHVFIPGGQLGYATDEDGAWRSEIVAAPAGRGTYNPTAAMDHAGTLHVAWQSVGWGLHSLNTEVEMASGRAGSWTIETVVPTMERVDSAVAFALDGQNRQHLAYVSAAEEVVYGVRGGGD